MSKVGTKVKIIYGLKKLNGKLRNPAAAIGNFDGVHLGHQAIFQRVMELAREMDGESVVITFLPHPLDVLMPEKKPSFITLHRELVRLIEGYGIDVVLCLKFTKNFAKIGPEEFIRSVLHEKIGLKALAVGEGYRFGRGRAGDIGLLKRMGDELGFSVEVVPSMIVDDEPVSSTRIRKLINEGRLNEAGRLLGRNHRIHGTVMKGRDRGGRLLGFPTANLQLTRELYPKPGVYAVQVAVGEEIYDGAANIGFNPTFGNGIFSVEAHLFDFDGDLYGREIDVIFIDRLRDEMKFSGPEELAAQIAKDCEKAREILSKID